MHRKKLTVQAESKNALIHASGEFGNMLIMIGIVPHRRTKLLCCSQFI